MMEKPAPDYNAEPLNDYEIDLVLQLLRERCSEEFVRRAALTFTQQRFVIEGVKRTAVRG